MGTTELKADHWWYVNSLTVVEDPAGSNTYRVDYTYTVNFRTVRRFYWELYVVESGCNPTDGFNAVFTGCTLLGDLADGNYTGTLASGINLCPGKTYDAVMYTRRRGDCTSDNTGGSGGPNPPSCGAGCGNDSCGCPEDRADAATPLGLLTKFPTIAGGDPPDLWLGMPADSLGDTPTFDGNWAYIRTTLSGTGVPDYEFTVDIEVDDCFGNFDQTFMADQTDGQIVNENFGGAVGMVRCGAPVAVTYTAQNTCGEGFPGNTFEVVDNSTIGGADIGSGNVDGPMGPDINVDGRFEELNGAIAVGNLCMDGTIDLTLLNSECSAENITMVNVSYDIEVMYPTSEFETPTRVNCSDVCGQNLIMTGGPQWNPDGLNMGTATTLPVTNDPDDIFNFDWMGQVCTPEVMADLCDSGSGTVKVDNCASCGVYDISYAITNDSCASCNTTTTKQVQIISPVITMTSDDITECGQITPVMTFEVVECNPVDKSATATPYSGPGDKFWERSDNLGVYVAIDAPGDVLPGETVTFTPHFRYAGCASCNAVGTPITVTSLGELVVNCPLDNEIGTYDCSNLATIPALPSTLAQIQAAPYNMVLGTDPCGTLIMTASDDGTPDACTGVQQTILRTITIIDDEDGSGAQNGTEDMQECVFTIIIEPAFVSPALVGVPADATITCDAPPTPTTLNYTNNGTNDCLSSGSITSTLSAYPGICGGMVTETWTIPSSANCDRGDIVETRTITISPPDAPTIVCPSNETVECAADIAEGIPTVTTSCGATSSVTTVGPTLISGDADCPGAMYTIVYTVEDECGTTASCTQTFTIANPAPTMTCPADANVECAADIVVGTAVVVTSCALGSTVTTAGPVLASGSANCPGATYEITYTAEDDCGRMVSCVQTFTIVNDPPTITCPMDAVVECASDIVAGTPTVTSSCGLTTSITTAGPTLVTGTADCPGATYEIVYTVEDDCGRTASCTQTFTIANPSPTISCPPDQNVTCAAEIMAGTPTVTTSCLLGSTITNTTPALVSGAANCPGATYEIEYTVTDACGRMASCKQTFTIVNAGPTITCPPDETVMCIDDIMAGTPTVTSSCGLTTTVTSTPPALVSGTADCSGATYSITYTVEDACGRMATCEQIFTLLNAPPTITCPTDEVVECASDIIIGTPTTTVACSLTGTVTTAGPTLISGDADCPGAIYQVVYTVTDDCMRTAECTQTFTIANPAPMITCPADAVVSCPSDIMPGMATFSTSCTLGSSAITTVGPTLISGQDGCDGAQYTIVYSAMDDCGRVASCTQTFTLSNTGPTITTCPGDKVIICVEDIVAEVGSVVFSTDCMVGGTVTAGAVVPNAANSACGELNGDSYSITYTVEDACGRMTTCTQTFTVNSTSPDISCAPDIIVIGCDASDAPTPDPSLIFGSAGCGEVTVEFVGDVSNGAPGCIGDTLVISRTYRVTNECGVASNCVQLIKIVDDVAPVITVDMPAVMISCDMEPPLPTVMATDNCSAVNIVLRTDTINFTCINDLTVVRTWIATDACGNQDSAKQEIQVFDATDPVFLNAPGDTIVSCIDMVPAVMPPDVDDNCVLNISDMTADTTMLTCPGEMVITRHWFAQDACGNMSSVSQTITVKDEVAPMITCPADIILTGCDISAAPPVDINSVMASDGCSDITITHIGDTRIGSGCPGDTLVISRIYRATDECGNFSECVQRIKIVDDEAPVITTCPATLVIVGCSSADAPAPNPSLVMATDNCSTPTYSHVGDSEAGTVCIGDTLVITRTYRATDACGNTTDCIQLIKIVDNVAPVITSCPPAMTVKCLAEVPPAAPGDVIATDNCGMPNPATLINTVNNGGAGCTADPYTVTYTYEVRDVCGNATTCQQVITVIDDVSPVITFCPPDGVAQCIADIPASDEASVVAMDNCGTAMTATLLSTTNNGGAGCAADPYILTYTYEVADPCGNTTTCEQKYTVIDDTAPVVTSCPPNGTAQCIADIPAATPALVEATDNCGGALTKTLLSTVDAGVGCAANPFTRTYTYQVTDACGNTTTCVQVYTVIDDTPPMITLCPADGIAQCISEIPAATPNLVEGTDNCGGGLTKILLSTTNTGTGCAADPYVRIYTYQISDSCGNTTTCTQTYTVIDDTPPVITSCPAPITVKCISEIPPADPMSVTATDNCGIVQPATLLRTTNNGGAGCTGDPYILTYTYEITDACGNATTCDQIITVIDDVAPTIISCPGPLTVRCIADIPPANPAAVIGEDNCDVVNNASLLTTTNNGGAGCAADPYILTYTYEITDACGNATTCDQVITVIDDEAPVITSCPADMTVKCIAEIPAATPAAVVATDNCMVLNNATLLSTTNNGGAGCTGDPYILTYTYEITDACGNATTCEQNITVIDDIDPVITTCPSDITVKCIAEIPAADPTGVVATDNCGVVQPATLINTSNNGGAGCAADPYILTYTFEVMDACGNSTTCQQNITVIDDIDPMITVCPPDGTAQCIAEIPPADPSAVVATDNCGVANPATLLTTTNNGGSGCSGDPYIRMYTYQVTDACGNSTTCVQSFTVIDNTPPMITSCPADGIAQCIAEIPPANPAAVTGTDNCGILGQATLLSTTDNGGAGCTGDPYILTYTYELRDACGNTSTCTQTFTVIDDTPPTITTCPAGDTFQCITDIPPATPGSVEATDNCGIVNPATLLSTTDNGGAGCSADPYILTYTYQVTDACGNATTCTQVFTVIDDTPPVITSCPADGIAQCVSEIPAADPSAVVATDNCGVINEVTLLSTNNSGTGCASDPYIRIYTYQVTDACGNATTCTQTFTVIDDTPPVITFCPADGQVQCIADIPTATPALVTGTDNCGIVNVATLLSTTNNGGSGCSADPYILTYTYELTDACGNATTCEQSFTVIDDTPPVITCPEDIVIIGCDISVAPDPDPSSVMVADNCINTTVTHMGDIVGGAGCIGDTLVIQRTYLVTDDCGLEVSCVQLIKIVDDIPPVVSGVTDLTVDCNSDVEGLFAAWIANNGGGMATDNCNVVTWSTIPESPRVEGDDLQTCVTFVASDKCGNRTLTEACFNINCASIDKNFVQNLDGDNSLDISVGDILEYRIEYTNEGSTILNNVVVRDDLIDPSEKMCPTLAPGETCVLVGFYEVQASDILAGMIVNNATGGSDETDEVSDEIILPVATPSIAIEKSTPIITIDEDGSLDMSVGDEITYTVLAINNGTSNLTDVVVMDNLITPGSNTCDLVPPGDTCILVGTYIITPEDVALGSIQNIASANSDQTPIIMDTVVVGLNQPDMSIVKSQPTNADGDNSGDVSLGDILTYIVTITNTGTANLTNVEIVDNTITQVGGSSPCALVLPGETCTLIGTYTVLASDISGTVTNEITNVATGSSDQTGMVSDSAKIEVPNPSIVISKAPAVLTGDIDESGDISVGDILTFTITATNNGNANLTDVVISDPLLDPDTENCGTLMMGESCQLIGTYEVTETDVLNGTFQNIASVSSVQPPLEEVDTAIVSIPFPMHEMTKSIPELIQDTDGSGDLSEGDILGYTIVVTNTGTANLTNVVITDNLISPMTTTCELLEPGETCELSGTYTIQSSDLGGTIANTATSNSDQTDEESDNADIIIPFPSIDIEKSEAILIADLDGNGIMTAGDTVQFTITATNTGTANLTEITINDDLIDPSSMTCDFLAPLETCVLTGVYVITQDDANAGMIKNVATVNTMQTDEEMDMVITTLPFIPELSFEKNLVDISVTEGVNPDLMDPDDILTYEYVITNTGTVTMTDIVVNDAGPSFNGIPGTNMLSTIVCAITTLEPGESTTCMATYIISQADFDNALSISEGVTNTASVSGTDPRDNVFESVVDDATGTLIEEASIEILKTAGPIRDTNGDGILWVDDEITYTFVVTNTGNSTLTDIVVSDEKIVGPIICEADELAPGESFNCTAVYILTEEDGAAGQVINTAIADGISQTGVNVTDDSDDPTDPTTLTNDPTLVIIPCPAIACPASVNVALDASDPFEVIPEVLGLPSGYSITLIDQNGDTIPGNLIDCSLTNISITFTAQHPCRPTACWGDLNIESKGIPDTTGSSYVTMCPLDPPNLLSVDEIMDNVYERGCFGALTGAFEEFTVEGDVCEDGTRTIRRVAAFSEVDETKVPVLVHIDTIDERPLSIDSIIGPKSADFETALTFVCRQSQQFPDLEPETVFVMAAYQVQNSFPHIDTKLEREFFDTVTIIDRIDETIVEDSLVMIDNKWVQLDVIVKDTIFRDRIIRDFRKVLIPLKPGKTCNLTVSTDDVFYDGCLGTETKLLRTWNVLDWCSGEIRIFEQWIKIIDDTPPTVAPIPDDAVSVDPWSCTANYKLPEPNISDDCTDFTFTWASSAGVIEDGIITNLTKDHGDVLVQLIATDNCENQRIDTFYVSVIDSVPPVAVAVDQVNVTLTKNPVTEEGTAKVFVDQINSDSRDGNCGEVNLCILRKEELDNPIVRRGVHLKNEDGDLLYQPSSCSYDGLYEFVYVENKVEIKEEIPYVVCKEFVKFCCEDEGIVDVALIVSDQSEFSQNAVSWSRVNVEDKSSVIVRCEDAFVSCGDSYHPDVIGYPIVYDPICSSGMLTYEDEGTLGACGDGVIKRHWYYEGEKECIQRIYVSEENNFDPLSIKWPKHFDGSTYTGIRRECVDDEIEETVEEIPMGDIFECTLEMNTGEPVWCEAGCILIGSTFEDTFVEADDACKKLIRRWAVVDWCSYIPNENNPDEDHDGSDTFEAVDDEWLINTPCYPNCEKESGDADFVYFRYQDGQVDEDGYYTFDQVIKIVDNTPPSIDVISSVTVDIVEGASSKGDDFDNCVNDGVISASASDLCGTNTVAAEDLVWTIRIIDESGNQIGDPILEHGVTVEINTGIGQALERRTIIWSVSDGCKNATTSRTLIEYIDTKAPTPVCIQDLSTTTMNSNGSAVIWAKDYDRGSFDNCGPVEVMFKDENGEFVPALEIDCDDIENGVTKTFELELYAIDASGNADFCNVTLRVDDEADVCEDAQSGAVAMISGYVRDRAGEMVPQTEVSINSGSKTITKEDGLYAFEAMAMFDSYRITGLKEEDYAHGVTSLDLVLIQQHILGIQPITDPYDLIAADVNNDQKISVFDMLHLRRLLLGLSTDFPGNTSWRFLDAQKGFDHPTHPWPFVDGLEVKYLDQNLTDKDLIGIKVGDVNGATTDANAQLAKTRTSKEMILPVKDITFEKGDFVTLMIPKSEKTNLKAIQFTLELDGLLYTGSTSDAIQIKDENIGNIGRDKITFVWTGNTVSESASALFTLQFQAQSRGVLSRAIRMTSTITRALAYDYSNSEYDLGLKFVEEIPLGTEPMLMQNEPNPFDQSTTISFFIPEAGDVSFTFYDVSGRILHREQDSFASGTHELKLTRANINVAGVIYYQMAYNDELLRKKMILIE